MCILIENNLTREYLTSGASWSRNPQDGKVFDSTTTALKAANHIPVENFNLVFFDAQSKPYLKLNYR